ncbi:MAG: nuclear transport factor 2 family protein [Gammaproteobacteria bacterium]|nr:nuclear transport factor 2 family protein [Gammaproteobacteria bacterium]
MTRSSTEVVEELIDAIANSDGEKLLRSLADDVTWTFFGSHRFAGTFKGKDELMNGLFAVIGDVLEDGIKLHVHSIVADGGRVIVEGKGQARSKAGLDYNNDYCLAFDVKAGKIQHVREYLDSELVTKVFGRG